ncbi:MAG: nickel pincer cofactor biosynthesis protein LarC [Kiritimatiellia bacterium]
MKKYIRFDSIGGASGDMILATLASVGADLEKIEKQLNSFFPEHLHIKTRSAEDSGLNGIYVSVHAHHHHNHDDSHWPDAEHSHKHTHSHGHSHRGLKEIKNLINNSSLSAKAKQLSLAVFTKLAEAEAEIHGKTLGTIHFHEVGAWDSVADIVGSCLALEQLEICGISCSALPCGTGTIKCAHGIMPNPAPATQKLLAGITTVQTEEPFELVTPTGAAILATWMEQLEKPPAECIPVLSGFGFGTRKLKNRPNVLRATVQKSEVGDSVFVLEAALRRGKQSSNNGSTLTVLETNLDDCNPEWVGTLINDLLSAGALDAWHTPIIMKKGRPGITFSALTPPETADSCRELIFRSTTTFGIRSYTVERAALEREFIEVETEWGPIPVKCGKLNGKHITAAPEHDICLRLAEENNLTLKEVGNAALAGYFQLVKD